MTLKTFRFVLLVFLFLEEGLFSLPEPLCGDVIPAANRIDWALTGIDGASNPRAIPNTSGWRVIDVTTRGLSGNGRTDNKHAFARLVASLPSHAYTVLYFPPGVYYTTGQFTVYRKDDLVIRGANDPAKLVDRRSVILLHSRGAQSVIKMGNSTTRSRWLPLAAGYGKGSTTLTLANSAGAEQIKAGQTFFLSELDDPHLTYRHHIGYGGAPNNRGVPDGTRLMAQFIRVTGVSGRRVTFTPPVYFGFKAAYHPAIKRQWLLSDLGVEDITLTRDVAGSNYQADNGLFFVFIHNSWAYNVESYGNDGAGIKWRYCFGGIARHCYIHDARATNSGHGYGFFRFNVNSALLSEDNIFIRMRHDLIFEGGGSGCVDAYNYCDDDYASDGRGWVDGSIDTHGSTPYCNLFEGDVTQKATHDGTHGNAVYNTWFRTWARGHPSNLSEPYGMSAFDFQYMSRYNAIVGCIAQIPGATGNQFWDTSAGWPNNVSTSYRLGGNQPGPQRPFDAQVPATTVIHRSFDYVSGRETEMNAMGLDSTLPASLYLSTRPGWWNDYVDPATGRPPPWPAIGPDLKPKTSMIPAQLRYLLAAPTVKPLAGTMDNARRPSPNTAALAASP